MFRHERKDKAVHLALSFCLRDLYEPADKSDRRVSLRSWKTTILKPFDIVDIINVK